MAASISRESTATSPEDPSHRQVAILLGLCAVSYLPAWLSFFVKDDIALITSAHLDLIPALFHSWPGGFFRPTSELIFAIQYRLFGLHPLPYHLLSFLAHSTVVLLVYSLLRLLPHYRAPALWAAVLFALHPLNTETVSWISGQLSLYAVLSILATLYLLRTSGPLITLLPVFVLGLGAYENFLLVIPLGILLYCSQDRPRIPLRPLALFAMGCCALIYLYWRFAVLGLSGGNYQASLSLKSAIVNLVYYLYLLMGGSVIGGRIIHYRPTEIGEHIFAVFTPFFLLNATIILLYLCYLRREAWRSPVRLALPLLWIAVALLPVLILPERPRRLCYLAIPGFSVAMAQIAYYLQKKIRPGSFVAKAGIAVYLLVIVSTVHLRNRDWHTAGALERGIPEAVSDDCRTLVFDAPNLLGDALFFNSNSTARWIGLHTVQPTVFSTVEWARHQRQINIGCYYRYVDGAILPVLEPTPRSAYPRGANWAHTR
jgi:hypothetical protein